MQNSNIGCLCQTYTPSSHGDGQASKLCGELPGAYCDGQAIAIGPQFILAHIFFFKICLKLRCSFILICDIHKFLKMSIKCSNIPQTPTELKAFCKHVLSVRGHLLFLVGSPSRIYVPGTQKTICHWSHDIGPSITIDLYVVCHKDGINYWSDYSFFVHVH